MSLVSYFKKERNNGGTLLPVNSVKVHVAAALNVSMGTVVNIVYKMKNNMLSSIKETRLHMKWVTNLNHLDIGSIRDQIYEMYKNNRKLLVWEVDKRVRDMQIFEGCKTFLHILFRGQYRVYTDSSRRYKYAVISR
ncbi:uncharacterized protein LOC143201616 [Rhynchophorus ferrugineus]|uniref:uncharacterized protein LOC143201616 n=1 Tax=Rhynchophorus ferrugineus TaxID=354439 RepID=UPI003FCE2071